MPSCLSRTLRLTVISSLPAILLILAIPPRPATARNQFDVCVSELLGSGVPGDQAATACSDAIIPKELSLCVSKIRGGTLVDAEDALRACYRVRRPVDLGNCVVDIHQQVLNVSVSASTTQTKTTEAIDTPETSPTTSSETSTETNSTDTSQTTPSDTTTETDTSETSPTPSLETPSDTTPETEAVNSSLLALDSCRRSLLPGRYSECVTGVSREVQDLTPEEAMATCLSAEDFPRNIYRDPTSSNPQQ